MILIDETTPRWMREIERLQRVKNLIFLHGNILDLVSYSVEEDGGVHWVSGDTIDGFLRRFLVDQGYPVVGVLDPLTGLEFADGRNGAMEKTYHTLGQRGPESALSSAEARPTQPAAARPQAGGRSQDDEIASAVAGMTQAMANTQAACAFVINLASRLITSPVNPSEREHRILAHLLKGSWSGTTAKGEGVRSLNNLIILVCDKLNDFPPYLYVDNPRARSIQVDKPDRAGRADFFNKNYALFRGAHPAIPPAQAPEGLAEQFGFLTEGMASYELQSLLHLSNLEDHSVEHLDELVTRYKFGITKSEWDSPELRQRLGQAEAIVRERIQGQDEAVERVTDLVKRAWLGLAAGDSGRSHRPRGVLFFAGPTGVGKTEMAKALARLLFGSEERMIRFDMSEYAAEHADQRLLGSPPGYVGYEEGGQLTNQVKERPFSVLLFDEIEKAHPRIFDKFLQILDDGRLTDGKGDTVYFSESVIVFTSNLGTTAVDSGDDYPKVREAILAAIVRHFNETLGRPEILNRFGDNFVVFDFIRPPLPEQILDHMVRQLDQAMRKVHGIELTLSKPARDTLVALAEERLDHGGRGIRNVLDRALVDPLARWLFDREPSKDGAKLAGLEITRISDGGDGARRRFSIEGSPRFPE